MKIGLLLRDNPTAESSLIMLDLVRLLSEWGAEVESLYPDASPLYLSEDAPQHDLYVLKSGSEGALSLAGALHAAGAHILNPFPVTAMLRDRAIVCRILRWAGIPTPQAYAAARPGDLAPLLDEGPLIIKPSRGSQGRGIQVVHDRSDLDQVPPDSGPVVAQQYKAPDQADYKIYCIGGQVFGVEREWPAETYQQKLGTPLTISPGLRDLALKCGRAFGIEAFGLDVIFSGGQPYVVDVNSFPGFKGVPNAGLRLADFIYAQAQNLDGPAAPWARRSAVR